MGEKVGRNDPCPCRSGKKFKKCCSGKRSRSHSVFVDMGRPVRPEMIEMTPDGRVSFYENGKRIEPVRAHVETTYERPKGPKVLRRVALDPTELIVKPDAALTRYARAFALDTNTQELDGESISIGCVMLLKFKPVGDGRVLAAGDTVNLLEFRNVSGPPERQAWRKLIELIQRNPEFDPGRTTGLLVDSDLGLLHEFNARTAPIVDDFYAPPGFELAYASADTGTESFANRAIKECDREATAMIKRIAAGDYQDVDLPKALDSPYTHFRLWHLGD